MEIPLQVSLTEGGGGNISVELPFPRVEPGEDVILILTGATLNEIKLIVGGPTPNVKLALVDKRNGEELVWPSGEKGNNIEPPPPPPGGIRIMSR